MHNYSNYNMKEPQLRYSRKETAWDDRQIGNINTDTGVAQCCNKQPQIGDSHHVMCLRFSTFELCMLVESDSRLPWVLSSCAAVAAIMLLAHRHAGER